MKLNVENRITTIIKGSPAESLGLRTGDYLISIDRHIINDFLDLMFYAPSEGSTVCWFDSKHKVKKTGRMSLEADSGHGIIISGFSLRQCKNNCIFCFINQLPKGLRRELYVKDEDYRLSFLYGNYITGSNLSKDDIERIIRERLSPLYVSIHTTDKTVRAQMLCNDNCMDIKLFLREMKKHKITVHGQIVVCPGHNDGKILAKTLRDLSRFHPSLATVALVPLGMTNHRKHLPYLTPVDTQYAKKLITFVESLKTDDPFYKFVFLSDEFYLLANRRPPQYRELSEFPQFDNGVGMYAQFYRHYVSARNRFLTAIKGIDRSIKICILTARLGKRLLERLQNDINASGTAISVDTVVIDNSVFGDNVTVSGLLCGIDFLNAIKSNPGYDFYMIPENSLRHEDNRFLDDMLFDDLKNTLTHEFKGLKPEQLIVGGDLAESLFDSIENAIGS